MDEHVSETEFDDENDENDFPARPSPPLRTPLSEHAALRDITDQFFHPPSPSPVRHQPPRRPRKPKSLAYPADPPNWSSLLATPSRASDSDPFGFVAVERAIKARRPRTTVKSPPRSSVLPSVLPPVLAVPIPTNNEDIEGLYADEPVAGPSRIVAPLLMMGSDQPLAEIGPALDPLRTPRKRKRRVSPTPDLYDPESDAPSTPSPVKVSVGAGTPVTRRVRTPGTPKRVKTSYQHIPTPSSTPASLRPSTAPSTPVLPRRSTRQAAVKLKGTSNDDTSRMQLRSRRVKPDADTGTKRATRAKQPKAPTRTQKPTTTAKPARGRPKGKSRAKDVKGKGKARPLESVLDLSDDTRERYEKERRERLEYFKRLEGYQMQKENVYVV